MRTLLAMAGVLEFEGGRIGQFDCGFTLPLRQLLEITGTAGWRPFHVGALCLAVTTLPLLFVSHPPTTDRDPHRRHCIR